VLLATSPTATNELWSWGPNILASQFHVEFDEPLVLQKIWATLKDVGRLDEGQAEDSRRVLEAGGQMNASMLQVGNPMLWLCYPCCVTPCFGMVPAGLMVIAGVFGNLRIIAEERQAEDSMRVLEAGGQINASMLQVGIQVVLFAVLTCVFEIVLTSADGRQAEDSRKVLEAAGQMTSSMLHVADPVVLPTALSSSSRQLLSSAGAGT
jgi:hypothetical protein